MSKQGIRTEFWASPQYHCSSRVYPTDKKTEFAMLSGGIDGKDHIFLCNLTDCTLPLESHRFMFDGEAYCQIRTGITKTDSGTVEEGVVKGSYGRTVRIEIMPSKSEIPKVLRATLEKSDYKIANPNNNMTVMKSGLLDDL